MLKTLYQIDSYIVKSMSGFIDHYCLMRSVLYDFLVNVDDCKVLCFTSLRERLVSSLSTLEKVDYVAFNDFFTFVTKKIALNYSKLDFS